MSDKIDKKWQYLTFSFLGIVALKTLIDKFNKPSSNDSNPSKTSEAGIKKKIDNEKNLIKSIQLEEEKVQLEKAEIPLSSPSRVFPPLTVGKVYCPPIDIPNLKRICFTGGPCGGKSSSLNHVSEKLRKLGYSVLIVPEAPTLIAQGGGMINIAKMDAAALIKFQNTLVKCVVDLEDNLSSIAQLTGKPTIMLCDRGTLDPRAYMTPDTWRSLLDDNNWNVPDLRDNRYHGVIHLVTVADGAEEHYTLENNAARYENTVELARAVDINLRNAWLGHHSYLIIDNSAEGGWPAKLDRVWEGILHFIGKNKSERYYRKYLLLTKQNVIPVVPDNIIQEQFDIEETVLYNADEDIEEKAIQKTQNGVTSYIHFTRNKRVKIEGEHHDIADSREKHEILKSVAYVQLLERADTSRIVIKKSRKYFIWERLNLFIDTYVNTGGFSVLYLEGDRGISHLKLPQGIEIDREVTLHREYSGYHLSKQLKK